MGASLSRFVKKYNLKNDAGDPLTLTISRFRPTFVSEMLRNGVTVREIQLMLGHSSLQTTLGYIDSLDFNSMSRMKINDELEEIHQSTLDKKVEKVPEDIESKKNDELVTTFHTPLAECRNIFDPPDFVKIFHPTYLVLHAHNITNVWVVTMSLLQLRICLKFLQ